MFLIRIITSEIKRTMLERTVKQTFKSSFPGFPSVPVSQVFLPTAYHRVFLPGNPRQLRNLKQQYYCLVKTVKMALTRRILIRAYGLCTYMYIVQEA